MGTHAEWQENLVADIDSMHQSRTHYLADLRTETKDMMNQIHSENLDRAEGVKNLLAQFRTENEERRDSVQDQLAQFRKEHGEMAEELHKSLGEFGADVREAAEIWQNRTAHSTRERSRLEEPGERQAKRSKKKGNQE